MALKIALSVVSLTAVVAGSVFLSRSLGQIRGQFNIPEQFMGLLTALGADSPEIASAIVAMIAGQRDVGVGVIFGSNLFNLAFLLGFSAFFAGSISVPRNAALLDGSVGVAITAFAVLVAVGVVSGIVALCGMLVVFVPYAILLALRRPAIDQLPLPQSWREFVASAVSDKEQPDGRASHEGKSSDASRGSAVVKVAAELAVIIAGSTGLVRYTTQLTAGWLPRSILGPLVLAGLTGIPNLYTAVRLGMKHRGSAVMTETMNSNSLNVIVGLAVPALMLGAAPVHTTSGYVEVFWLLAMTCAVVASIVASRGLKRWHGLAVLLAYGAFVAARVWLA